MRFQEHSDEVRGCCYRTYGGTRLSEIGILISYNLELLSSVIRRIRLIELLKVVLD